MENNNRLELSVKHKMPPVVRIYLVTKVLLLVSAVSISFSLISGSFFDSFLVLFLFFGMPLIIYYLLAYEFVTFVIEENRITINYGIIIKNSTTVSYKNVQSVKNRRGILAQIFGISDLKAWTASPEKINVRDSRKEDISLYLLRKDADWLKEFINKEVV
jgi:uncharacterized membrane protein YdbT with pleckstrin-like domain